MEFDFRPLEKPQALAILDWHYPAPYDFYDFRQENRQADLYDFLDPQNAFFAILNCDDELEGYCSFGSDGQVPGGSYRDQALDIGMGIRPDRIGQGRGSSYARAVADYGVQCYQMTQLRVTIATFNQRAQRVWRSLGFEPIETFYKTDTHKEFVVMVGVVESGSLLCYYLDNARFQDGLNFRCNH